MMDNHKVRSKVQIFIDFLQDFRLAFSMFRAYFKGDYREISRKTFFSVIGALVYMLSPLGIMVGMIPVLGWVDDIVIIILLIKVMHDDLEKYRKFKDEKERRSR